MNTDDELDGADWSSLQKPPVSGFVYLLRSPHGFKIGCARNVERRVSDITTLLPFEVTVEHTFPAPDMYAAESALHFHFSAKRIRSEWFALDESDVADIKTIRTADDVSPRGEIPFE
jgi:hypothetical protein